MAQNYTCWIVSTALALSGLTPALAQNSPPQGQYGRPAASQNNPQGSYYGNSLRIKEGQLKCESKKFQYKRCAAITGYAVELVQQFKGDCTPGRNWGYDGESIWVNHGCRAKFHYGFADFTSSAYAGQEPNPQNGNPGEPANYPNTGYPGTDNTGFALKLRCESANFSYRSCPVQTAGRVVMLKALSGDCQLGRSWGYDRDDIWVNNGCRAEFGVGIGTVGYDYTTGGKPNTGKTIAGVALAAGLVALLAAATGADKKPVNTAPATPALSPPASPSPPATSPVVIPLPPVTPPKAPSAKFIGNLNTVAANDRVAVETCITEAANRLGATGGTQFSIDRLLHVEKLANGQLVRGQLVASFPDRLRSLPLNCRVIGNQVFVLEFVE